MKTEKINPDDVLAALKARLKSRAHPNLDNVHDVCRAIHNIPDAKGPKNYSLSAVGRKLAEQNKSPNFNTLNSLGGAHFKELIKAWAQWDGVAMTKRPARTEPKDYDMLLGQISNPAVRSEVRLLLAEASDCRAELQIHKSQTMIVNKRPKDPLADATRINPEFPLPKQKATLLSAERDAILAAINPKHLEIVGLHIGPNGEVKSGKKILFAPGFITGIKKLMDSSEQDILIVQ